MTTQLSPRGVVYTLFNRWKLLVLFFTMCLLMACLYIYFVPWRYKSDAQIVVKVGEQDIADDNITLPPGQTRQQASADIVRRIVNTRVDILQSNDVTRATLQKLGVEKIYPEIVASSSMFSISSFFGARPLATRLDAANKRLINDDLTVTVAPNSNTLKVSLVNRNPSVAQETLRTLIALFMEKDSEVMRNTRVNFLDEQVAGARAKVDTAQRALLEYKKENGLVSLYDERLLLLKQRDLLEQDLSAQNTQSLQLSVAAAHNLLAAAEQRHLQAKNTYSPANPLLQDSSDTLELVRRQYNALMSLLANNLRSRPRQLDSTRDNSASPFVANNALVNLWMSQLKSVNDRLDQFDLAEGKLLDLQRQLDVATQEYTTFMQRTADARATEALNQQGTPSIAISQEPTLPYEPARPRILLVLGLAGVLGLIGGAGLCFFLQAVGKTIGLPEQVEPLLGLPVIATLNYSRVIKKLARGS